MLPAVLKGSYRQYKSDTTAFIQWLTETAGECGYISDSVKAQPLARKNEAPSSKRLKGKARKQAKSAAVHENAPVPMQSQPSTPVLKRTVLLKELIPQAKAIAGCVKTPATVPVNVVRLGTRALSARKRCTAWFKDQMETNPNTSRSNHQHSYFIDLFEELLVILQPLYEVGPTSEPKPEEAPASSSKLTSTTQGPIPLENFFMALEVEDLEDEAETDEQTKSSNSTRTSAAPRTVYELESPKGRDGEEDLLFAIFCLFDDCCSIRQYILEVWSEYKTGKLDLISASVTTNTAFEQARRAEEDFIASSPRCQDFQKTLNALAQYFPTTMSHVLDEPDSLAEIPEDIADFFNLREFNILDTFCDTVVQEGHVPLPMANLYNQYDPSVDRSKLNVLGKYGEDQIIMFTILPEIALLEEYGGSLPSQDEMTRGCREMYKNKKIPIWLVFACRIFLEIHHLLRKEVSRGCNDMKVYGSHIQDCLQEYFAFSRSIQAPNTWVKENEAGLHGLYESTQEWIMKDRLQYIKQTLNLPSAHTYSQQYYLLERHPILCGIFAFSLILDFQELGIVLANAWGMTYSAHLYNALRQKNMPIGPWPDMELMIKIHTPERVFVGEAPKDIQDCFKQVCLWMGAAPDAFAPNRRPSRSIFTAKKGPRALKDSSLMARIFRARYCYQGCTAVTMYNIEELLNEMAREKVPRQAARSIQRRWERSLKLNPIQLLQTLKVSISSELPNLLFDYFAMNQQCLTLLREIRTRFDAQFFKFVGPEYLENESQLPFLVVFILRIAVGSNQIAQMLPRTSRGSAHSALMTDIGEAVQNFVAEQCITEYGVTAQGVAECMKVNTICVKLRLAMIAPGPEDLSHVKPYQKPDLCETRFDSSRIL